MRNINVRNTIDLTIDFTRKIDFLRLVLSFITVFTTLDLFFAIKPDASLFESFCFGGFIGTYYDLMVNAVLPKRK